MDLERQCKEERSCSSAASNFNRRQFLAFLVGFVSLGVTSFWGCSKNPKAPEEKNPDKEPDTDHLSEQRP